MLRRPGRGSPAAQPGPRQPHHSGAPPGRRVTARGWRRLRFLRPERRAGSGVSPPCPAPAPPDNGPGPLGKELPRATEDGLRNVSRGPAASPEDGRLVGRPVRPPARPRVGAAEPRSPARAAARRWARPPPPAPSSRRLAPPPRAPPPRPPPLPQPRRCLRPPPLFPLPPPPPFPRVGSLLPAPFPHLSRPLPPPGSPRWSGPARRRRERRRRAGRRRRSGVSLSVDAPTPAERRGAERGGGRERSERGKRERLPDPGQHHEVRGRPRSGRAGGGWWGLLRCPPPLTVRAMAGGRRGPLGRRRGGGGRAEGSPAVGEGPIVSGGWGRGGPAVPVPRGGEVALGGR